MTRRKIVARCVSLAWLAIIASHPGTTAATPPQQALSADAGQLDRLGAIDEVVARAIDNKQMPGCVVLVGRQQGVVWRKAYGQRQVLPTTEAMTVDTLFDIASLTKPIATATSVMQLVDRGKLQVSDKVSQHLPEFTGQQKEEITVEQLLLHTSGLIADNHLRDYQEGSETAWERICELKLSAAPGERFVYSDVGFIVLGKLVERVSGEPLDMYARTNLFTPLGMTESGYKPSTSLRDRAAPTEQRNGEWMRGEVHDPRAYELGGVAGHAGVFSTADDLAKYATAMLQRGGAGNVRIFSEDAWKLMTAPREVPGRGLRALGWDSKSGYSSNRGKNFSPAAFGHGGFTGTALWIDPELDLYVVFLSNRLHPDGKGSVNALAGEIGTIAADALKP